MDVLLNDSSRVNPRTVGRLVKKKEWRLDSLLCGALHESKGLEIGPSIVWCFAREEKGCMHGLHAVEVEEAEAHFFSGVIFSHELKNNFFEAIQFSRAGQTRYESHIIPARPPDLLIVVL
jgi:hypothetical protein